jgi:hypothetical protein
MPIYDYECYLCGLTKSNEFVHNCETVVRCENCDIPMDKLFHPTAIPQVFPAEGITLHNVAAQPVTFHSKKQMQQYAKTHDLELGALL